MYRTLYDKYKAYWLPCTGIQSIWLHKSWWGVVVYFRVFIPKICMKLFKVDGGITTIFHITWTKRTYMIAETFISTMDHKCPLINNLRFKMSHLLRFYFKSILDTLVRLTYAIRTIEQALSLAQVKLDYDNEDNVKGFIANNYLPHAMKTCAFARRLANRHPHAFGVIVLLLSLLPVMLVANYRSRTRTTRATTNLTTHYNGSLNITAVARS